MTGSSESTTKVIAKDSLTRLLSALLESYQLVAPVRRSDDLVWDRVTSGDEVVLEFANTKLSPKSTFFPRTEIMFLLDDGKVAVPAALGERIKQVILGVRPCDAASFPLLDAVFVAGNGEPDPYYAERRASTAVVGLTCTQPTSTCFCNWVGGGPFSQKGLDVTLTDLGDRYLAQVNSSVGELLLKAVAEQGLASLLLPATAEDLQKRERLASAAQEQLPSSVLAEGLQDKLARMYDDPFWDDLHQKCLGCGVCTYLCPTCHCFDILDETNGHQGRRVRIWDSCQYSHFTRHASGHNPRPAGKERMRQRVMHKFRYFVASHGENACVGCGRCIRYCPASMDIRQVLGDIATLTQVVTR